MKRSNIKKVLVVTLFIIEFFSLFLTIKTFNSRNIKEIKEEQIVDNKKYGMYIENSEGKYEEYTDNELFPNNLKYTFNNTKSSCVDALNNIVENAISYSDNKITVTSNKTSYCYLYFDAIKLIAKGITSKNSSNLNKEVEGELYRYQGTHEQVNDNYICFGTSDMEKCKNEKDKYMYRIIGLTEDGQVKVLKYLPLDTAYYWHNTYATDVAWVNSDLYKGLNNISGGTYNGLFINSGKYAYMMTSGEWYNKVAETAWHYGNTTSINKTAQEMYNVEKAFSTTTSKIGLMYVHDYYYSLPGGNNCSSNGDPTLCTTSWMYMHNYETSFPDTYGYEWFITRYGYSTTNAINYGYMLNNQGAVILPYVNRPTSIRPVFYIKADSVYKEGNGKIETPFMIEGDNLEQNIGQKIRESYSTNLSTSLVGGMYRYQGTNVEVTNNYICFGANDTETCTSDTDQYIYRIIGITETGSLKLIKRESLYKVGTSWHTTYSSDVPWADSELFKALNGTSSDVLFNNLYLKGTTYPYLSEGSVWYNKIVDTEWKYVTTTNSGSYNGNTIYNIENGTSAPTIKAKIGLMYIHDFLYAYEGGEPGSYSNAATAWIHLSSNDSDPINVIEWTMSRYGYYNPRYYAWHIDSVGRVDRSYVTYTYAMRPVFYLNETESLKGGTGTLSDPFLIN